MARKERTATEALNISLAGLESALTILEGFIEGNERAVNTLAIAQERTEEIRNHLLTIQFHLSQLR